MRIVASDTGQIFAVGHEWSLLCTTRQPGWARKQADCHKEERPCYRQNLSPCFPFPSLSVAWARQRLMPTRHLRASSRLNGRRRNETRVATLVLHTTPVMTRAVCVQAKPGFSPDLSRFDGRRGERVRPAAVKDMGAPIRRHPPSTQRDRDVQMNCFFESLQYNASFTKPATICTYLRTWSGDWSRWCG